VLSISTPSGHDSPWSWGQAGEDTGAHQTARGGCEHIALVAAVGGIGKRGHHVDAGFKEAIAHGETVPWGFYERINLGAGI
jgi:hypothetical protein